MSTSSSSFCATFQTLYKATVAIFIVLEFLLCSVNGCSVSSGPPEPINLAVALAGDYVRLMWQRSLAGTIDSFDIEALPDGVTLDNCIGVCLLNLPVAATCLGSINCTFSIDLFGLVFGSKYGFSVRSVNCRDKSEPAGPVHIQLSGPAIPTISVTKASEASTLVETSSESSTNMISSTSAVIEIEATETMIVTDFHSETSLTTLVIESPTASVILSTNVISETSLTAYVIETLMFSNGPTLSTVSSLTSKVLVITMIPTTPSIAFSASTTKLHASTTVSNFTNSTEITDIPVWIIGVVVSVFVVMTTLITTTLFIFSCIVRKRLSKSKRGTSPQQQVVDNSATSCNHQQIEHAFDHSLQDSRNSVHIYSVPNWNRDSSGSMIYNQAYQESFVLTVNAAYFSSIH